jgi:hypothetical protein
VLVWGSRSSAPAETTRLRWGVALVLPSGLALLVSWLMHTALPSPWFGLVVLAFIAGIFVLFHDMP